MIRIIAVLTLVCVLCAFFLALVHGLVIKKIELNAAERLKSAINNIAPDAATIKEIPLNQEAIYRLEDSEGVLIGYAFIAQGQGYQGKIKILAVIVPSLSQLEGIEVVDSIETPGLGAKIAESSFSDQFKKLNVREPIVLWKQTASDSGEVEASSQATEVLAESQIAAITGATVSSKAVVTILNKRIELLKEQIEHLAD